ncbi:hypothetical protein HG530_000835 [Fusarium avenaceum]|nr:hypothetical protein HG530_000835 [Fusarium avenaceum]
MGAQHDDVVSVTLLSIRDDLPSLTLLDRDINSQINLQLFTILKTFGPSSANVLELIRELAFSTFDQGNFSLDINIFPLVFETARAACIIDGNQYQRSSYTTGEWCGMVILQRDHGDIFSIGAGQRDLAKVGERVGEWLNRNVEVIAAAHVTENKVKGSVVARKTKGSIAAII